MRNSPAAAHQIALKLIRGVGKTTLQKIRVKRRCGWNEIDGSAGPVAGPSGTRLWGLSCEEFVVLDTETTGVDAQNDDVIEVAAVRVRCGQMVDSYQGLDSTQPIGWRLRIRARFKRCIARA